MKQWLLLIACLFILTQHVDAQNSRKATILCDNSETLYDVDLGTTCVEGTEDERKKQIGEQIKAITDFNNAFIAAKISSLFVCDNSNCPNPITMDCNKSAQVLRVKFKLRKISKDKYEVQFLGVIRVSCSTCSTTAGGTGLCGADTFFTPVDVLVECGTGQIVTVGPASLYFNGSAAQAATISANAATSLTNYYTALPGELPVNPKCYDIICEPGEICNASKSLASVTASPPVLVDNNPPCYRLDFYLDVSVECSSCEKEKEEKDPEELSPLKNVQVIDQIYPNPVQDYLMIELTSDYAQNSTIQSRAEQSSVDNITLYIVDNQGKRVFSSPVSKNEKSFAISVHNIPDGIHFVLIESEGKILERRKVIINKD